MVRPKMSNISQVRKNRASDAHHAHGTRSFRRPTRTVFLSLLLSVATVLAIPAICKAGSVVTSGVKHSSIKRKGIYALPVTAHIDSVLLAADLSGGAASHQQAESKQDDAIERAKELVKQGSGFVDDGDFDRGEKSLRAALAIYQKIPNPDALVPFGEANCYLLLGSIADKKGDDENALALWQKASALFESLEGGALEGTVAEENLKFLLIQKLYLFERRGRLPEALDAAQKIAEIEARVGASDSDQSDAKLSIGVFFMRLGRLHDAENTMKEALTLSERGNSPPESQAGCLYNLALDEAKLGAFAAAEKYSRQALDLVDRLDHKERTRGEIRIVLATTLFEEGRGDEGQQTLQEALAVVSGIPELREMRAEILVDMAHDFNKRLNRKEDANRAYKEALSLIENRPGSEKIQVVCLSNIGVDLANADKTEEAAAKFREALAIIERKDVNVSQETIVEVRRNFALVLSKTGEFSEALDDLTTALRGQRSRLSRDFFAMTQQDKQDNINELAPISNVGYTVALRAPASLASRAYEILLLTKALQSEANRVEQQSILFSGIPETLPYRDRYIEVRKELSRRTLDSAHIEVPTSNDDLTTLASDASRLELELRGKASLLQRGIRLEQVTVEQVRSQLRPGEVLLDYFKYSPMDLTTLTATGQHYGVFRLDGPSGKVELIDLGEAKAITEAIKAVRDCERSQVHSNGLSLDENQLAKLNDQLKRLIIDPVLPATDHVKRIYIAPDGNLGLVSFDALPTGKSSSGWKYLAEDVEVVYLLSGRDLTRTSSQKSASSEAWLVGDPDFDSTAEERLAVFNSSFSDHGLHHDGGTSQGSQGSEVIGQQHRSEELVPTDWPPLEDTRSLITAIATEGSQNGIKAKTLLGPAASEEFLSRVRAPRILMFATHGYFMTSMPPVHIKLELTENRILNDDFFETGNPLHRSMLILAGANRRNHHVLGYASGDIWITEEQAAQRSLLKEDLNLMKREVSDGLLTAYEVLGLDLEGTDLVILAGCESGLGVTVEDENQGLEQTKGESIAGLKQAFTIAGARSVVTTLWEVPLDQTIEQMRGFMHLWLSSGLPRYRAFHESQLTALKAARAMNRSGHPFWWAGFVYFGDPGDR